jgi:hypothetical protein
MKPIALKNGKIVAKVDGDKVYVVARYFKRSVKELRTWYGKKTFIIVNAIK